MKSLFKKSLLIAPMAALMIAGSSAAQDPIPKFLVIQIARDQSAAMCSSEVFTQCMGFEKSICLELSEKAVETCLGPLPAEIDPAALQNSTLEACPRKLYTDAGYSEEKAKGCFDKAVDAASG